MSLKVLRAEVVLPIVMLIVLVSVGWTRQADKRTWEYQYLQLHSAQTYEEHEKLLTQQGLQRWELVEVLRENTGGGTTTHFYFKRAR